MNPPWHKLKQTEIHVLELRERGEIVPEDLWNRLRELFEQCRGATNASEAICYHGVASLLAEHVGDKLTAIQHRRIEIDKIRWLHALERQNPSDGHATQDYRDNELAIRFKILAELETA